MKKFLVFSLMVCIGLALMLSACGDNNVADDSTGVNDLIARLDGNVPTVNFKAPNRGGGN
jgi:ABC-type oligopeptide transport system substrate-binding subunit